MLKQLTWAHWMLAIIYASLSASFFFKFAYELGAFFNWSWWAGYVYTAAPGWVQLAMDIQSIVLASLWGVSVILRGDMHLPWPALDPERKAGSKTH